MQDSSVCKFLCLFLIIITSINSSGQVIMTEANLTQRFYSGICTAIADMNGDNVDDIIVLDQSKQLWIGINTGKAKFIWSTVDYRAETPIWAITIGDVDHDYHNDIIVSADKQGSFILYNTSQGFKQVLIEDSRIFSQASTLYDLNRDGRLDLTLCDDNAHTRIYIADAKAKLIENTTLIDLKLSNPAMEAGNYGCTWMDFDIDGDADLYLSRCRGGIEDPTDLRRKNFLYVNNNGQFIEQGDIYKIGIGDQSWCSTFRDLDGDLLPDLIVVNHYTACRIFKQLSDHSFVDVTTSTGVNFNGIPIQIAVEDFNNDGLMDILFAGTANELYLNNGRMNFSKAFFQASKQVFTGFSVGDLNNDGALDIYTSYGSLLNNPNNKNDKLFLSEKNANHYINITLRGVQSNTNGIGAKIFVYTGARIQYREHVIGESFGIQNSQNIHFGLLQNTMIDSIKIIWPSGINTKFTNITSDRNYLIGEDNCISPAAIISPTSDLILCNGQFKTIIADTNLFNIEWNNKLNNYNIEVNDQGIYFYTATDSNGCLMISNPIGAFTNPIENPKLNYTKEYILCDKEQITLEIENYHDIAWQDNNTELQYPVNKAGIYYAKVKGECQDFYSDTLIVDKMQNITIPTIANLTINSNHTATLISNNVHTKWYNTPTEHIPLHVGDTFNTPVLQNSTSYFAAGFEQKKYHTLSCGLTKPEYQTDAYQAAFLNPKMQFTVFEDMIIESVTVYTDRPGTRRIELIDGNLNKLDSIDINLQTGRNIVPLNFICEAKISTFSLTTNSSINMGQFQSNSPWLQRSDIGFYYPIFLSNLGKITSSSNGEKYYYYFYDWKIRKMDKICESDRKEVKVKVITSTTNQNNSTALLSIKNKTLLFNEDIKLLNLKLFTLDKKEIIYIKNPTTHSVFLQDIPLGIYFIQYQLGDKIITEKIILN